MADVINTGMLCPECRDTGKSTMNPIMTKVGTSEYFCSQNHRFNDMQELRERNPGMVKAVPKPPKPIPNAVALTIPMPPELLGILTAKFSDKLQRNAMYFLQAMAQPGAFIVDERMAVEIGSHLGNVRPDSATKLKGMVFSMATELSDAKEKLKAMDGTGKSGGSSGPGLDFDEDILVTLKAKAKAAGLSLRAFYEQIVLDALNKGRI
jgi:hypothetical protein